MDPNTRALMMGAAGAGGAAETLYVEDVFSTWIYDGISASQTITNGIDLSGKGGMTWIKVRNGALNGAVITDTIRGANSSLITSSASAPVSGILDSFGSSGFTTSNNAYSNTSGNIYASWTFRKAAKFFDVVTYVGDGTNRTIAHNLGSVPGCIIVRRTDVGDGWHVYHRSLAATEYMLLDDTGGRSTLATVWNSTAPTSSVFSLGTNPGVNASGGTYVAYLFAHDAAGFGAAGDQNIISCGSYSGNGSTAGPVIDLGWEPQWLMIKQATGGASGNWRILDNMRGIGTGGTGAIDVSLCANLTTNENSANVIDLRATGFTPVTTNTEYNGSGDTYIYIAIRRGPMKTPTDATKVFQPKVYTGTNVDNRLVTTDIVTDMAWIRQRNDAVLTGMVVGDRLRGQPYLLTGGTAAEVDDADSYDAQIISATEYGNAWSSMTGLWVGNDPTAKLNANTQSNNHVALAFRRAPGFFDIVTYAGNATAGRTISHNLGVAPEMIIVRARSTAGQYWYVYHSGLNGGTTPHNYRVQLNQNAAEINDGQLNNTAPTSSVFSVSADANVNGNNLTYVAYLFASCPGVSKVGRYAGGGIINVDCGFTSGARFVMIKCATSTGAWYVWDTARGINASTVTEPYLRLNGSNAETAGTSYIDTLSSGFQIPVGAQTAEINDGQSTTNYIYLAIA